MSGISMGHSLPRPSSGKKTLRRCRNNEEADNVILIDVDSENFDNVIIIDIPESLPKKNQGSSMLRKDKKWSFRNVIDIDDDETPESSHFIGVNNVSFSAGTSSNRESFRAAQNFGDSVDVAIEDCQFVQDNATPVRLSKCKRTYSGKASTKNHYGLDAEFEYDLSDNDNPDCEIMEDSSGEVQEMWEKAFSRKRKDVHNDYSGIRDHDSTSRHINRDHCHAESKDETRQHKEASFYFNSGKSNDENNASSPFRTKEDTDFGSPHLSDDAISDQQYNKSDAFAQSNSQAKCRPSIHVEQADCPDCEPESSSNHIEKRRKNPVSSNFASQEASIKKFNHPIPVVEDEETSKVGSCPPRSDLCVDEDFCNGNSSPIEGNNSRPVEGEDTICKSKSSFEHEINQERSFPGDNHKNVHETATGCVEERDHFGCRQSHATGGAKERESLMPERCSFGRTKLPDKQTELNSTPCDAVDVSGKSLFSKSHSGEGTRGSHKENRPVVPEIPLSGGVHNEAKLQDDNSMSNIQQQENEDGQLHSQNGDFCSPVETCIINEREKLKETDEYKRVIEEEWASRQQALHIQAEEARRLRLLRKRRKAESMRLLDMERRQKERIEEMRNIQKKDEENMNLKERIRGGVRNELKKLESECKNMASLLHLLGIRVGSWPNPSPQEVQVAYKRALLTFHPDRAPKSDIRQQVEAEEKFKLINRLKEKFPPS